MKKLLLSLATVFVSTLVFAQTTTENHVKTTVYQIETPNGNVADHLKNENIIYYDGLGRPIQQIAVKQSPNSKDIINHIEYDDFGRQSKQYLPYTSTDTNYGMYRTDALIKTQQFYNTAKYENTLNPYSETFFDGTPLNLVVEQSAPGNDWLEGIANEHTIKNEYKLMTETDLVRWFKVEYSSSTNTSNPSLIYKGYYEVDESQNNYRPPLYKFITKNENWKASDGNDNTIHVFKDYRGRTLLSRAFDNNELHDTYYVYDDFGNLIYVIPPLASDQIIDEGDLGSRIASQTNYPWTNLVEVDKDFAEDYDKKLSDYNNDDILNADLENEYNGQGGFTVTTFANSEAVTLNLSFSATNSFALKQGVLISLKAYGIYKDTELGRIEGSDYTYIFIIKGNNIIIEKNGKGKGELNTINETFNSNIKLSYSHNYPWTSYIDVDPGFAAEYEKALGAYSNSDILNVNMQNPYGGQGGLNISVDENDVVNITINSSLTTSLALKNGVAVLLNMKRSLADRELGNISGNGYYYTFSIVNNNLFIQGEGDVRLINTVLTTPPPPTVNSASIAGLCYKYIHDDKNRIFEKLTPGKSKEYVVYDKLDRPIMTQNAYQSAQSPKEWSFVKYDALGRVAYTGIVKNNNSRYSIQNSLNTSTLSFYESKVSNPTVISSDSNTELYYTNDAYPNTGDITIHTINYYDNYNFDSQGLVLADNTSIFDDEIDMNTKSLPTGSKIRVLSTDFWTTAITQYNNKAEVIYVVSKNEYLNTTDIIKTDLDFLGRILASESSHTKGTNSPIVKVDRFTYDHAGRILAQTQTLNNSAEELISYVSYDELGQVESKKVGGEAVSNLENSNGLQTINYDYNIRGWLKGINNTGYYDIENDLFTMKIDYNTPQQTGVTALYNGNISSMSWRTASDKKLRSYTYEYDALNRLKNANYTGGVLTFSDNVTVPLQQDENYSLKEVSYDKNGNLLHLERYGIHGAYAGTGSNITTDIVDGLNYFYAPNSNKLLNVTDFADNGFNFGLPNIDNGEFLEKYEDGNKYEYDNSGNLTKDKNKSIALITYNFLNLPTNFYVASGVITIYYDAMGTKLSKQMIGSNGNIKSINYANDYIYETENGIETLKLINQPEGYIEQDGQGRFSYAYQYKDHLGNIRVTYKEANNLIVDEDYNNDSVDQWSLSTNSIGYITQNSPEMTIQLKNGYDSVEREFTVRPSVPIYIEVTSGTWGGVNMVEAFVTVEEYINNNWEPIIVEQDSWTIPGILKRSITPSSNLIRVLFNKAMEGDDGILTTLTVNNFKLYQNLEIIEENHYYPFGSKHKGYNTISANVNNMASKFKYNGKEFEEAFGLNLYEMDMRQYDPAIARWTGIDPVTHHSMSTYTAFDNNPIYWADPSGANSRARDDIDMKSSEDRQGDDQFDRKWGSTTYYGGGISMDRNGINVSGYTSGGETKSSQNSEVGWLNSKGELVYNSGSNEGEGGYTENATDQDKLYGNTLKNSGKNGLEKFNKLVNSDHPIKVIFSNYNNKLALGHNDVKTNADITKIISETITIWVPSHKDKEAFQSSEMNNLANKYSFSIAQKVATTFGHEIAHGTINNAIFARREEENTLKGPFDKETIPNRVSLRIAREIANKIKLNN